ncbi:uncharacterized protein K452DRAFT_300393 [Aplosporella prunicola CBS 121167]|uniref:Uncharacterized protein n=1 Tax=Aplosporella prunicola CBS 121167 TaxID=1176127 RepID=A0A6A6B6R7_9PEZI|nr:uncharacterized protein K452DRAFT_300393 [Aplosporella prunicola CBS 121167]KAF2139338.1 hypothetical protein K452DRAFT_300393 [Aplosporella prunicola CBS 121167]
MDPEQKGDLFDLVYSPLSYEQGLAIIDEFYPTEPASKSDKVSPGESLLDQPQQPILVPRFNDLPIHPAETVPEPINIDDDTVNSRGQRSDIQDNGQYQEDSGHKGAATSSSLPNISLRVVVLTSLISAIHFFQRSKHHWKEMERIVLSFETKLAEMAAEEANMPSIEDGSPSTKTIKSVLKTLQNEPNCWREAHEKSKQDIMENITHLFQYNLCWDLDEKALIIFYTAKKMREKKFDD